MDEDLFSVFDQATAPRTSDGGDGDDGAAGAAASGVQEAAETSEARQWPRKRPQPAQGRDGDAAGAAEQISDEESAPKRKRAAGAAPAKGEADATHESAVRAARRRRDAVDESKLHRMRLRKAPPYPNTPQNKRIAHEYVLAPEAPSEDVVFLDRFEEGFKPAKEYSFELDPFQMRSVQCIERNESVLVSAHTSAGKTVVAEYAIAKALRDKQRVIYTSPIKALSNQKYRDLYEQFSDVGLMTGDVTISPHASCLVMTTEILRSMLYRGSEIMREVAWVVYDEIHYMRDKERGVVWEESIIMLPHNVRFVFLSATIPNATEFAGWIAKVHKQTCHVVYTEFRPTPLQHYLFPAGGKGLHLVVDEKGTFRDDNFQRALSEMAETNMEAQLDDEAAAAQGGKKKRKPKKEGGLEADLYRIVKMVMDRNYDPVIIFSFSKRDCERYALKTSKIDFTSEDEKRLVSEVFHNAIDSLSDDDKKLPQVESILPLLMRGVGIHHGGLLPIIKEVIEILFQESLIKCLFATETFAMGINMPAKTVVFTATRKFDGQDFRWVSAGEYIQMSGRAGRRGLDDRGIVIQMLDEKMEPHVGREILKGTADPLNSTFHLGYNMLLNLLRVEDADPEFMILHSFHQFQNELKAPRWLDQAKEADAEAGTIAIEDEEAVAAYYSATKELFEVKEAIRGVVNQQRFALPFMQPGRLARVRDGTEDFGWGVVTSFSRHKAAQAPAALDRDGGVTQGPDAGNGRRRGPAPDAGAASDEIACVVDMLLLCDGESLEADARGKVSLRPGSRRPRPASDKASALPVVVPVLLPLLDGVSSVRLYLPRDIRRATEREAVWRNVREALRRMGGNVPVLDPVTDMDINAKGFKQLIKRREALEKQLQGSPVHTSETRAERFAAFERKQELVEKARTLRERVRQAQALGMRDTLKRMKRVLRRLGLTGEGDVIQLKGRVAAEISTSDELLMTELMFNGTFTDLTPEQSVALLSCMVFQEKSDEVALPKELERPFQKLQETARRVASVSSECKLPISATQYLERFNPGIMEVVYAWSKGAKFSEVMKMTKAFEGSIIRAIRRLEELLRQLTLAAKSIGNTDMEEKFAAGVVAIKRDIVFAASLYL